MNAPHVDYWAGRFAPAQEHNAGGGRALYRRCLKCNGHALIGSLSAHASWCDREQYERQQREQQQEAAS